MFVYVARHAWAGHYGDPRFSSDAVRPLTEAGRERYRRVLESVAPRALAPRVIATSPLRRCVETAELMASCVSGEPTVVELEALEPGSDVEALIRWTRQQGEQDVAWVGHAPDVSHLAAALVGTDSAGIRFAKGAIAAIRFDEQIKRGSGQLQWLVTAKILGC